VRADREAAAFVGGGDESEQQLGGGVVERGEPDLVDDDQVVTQGLVDESSDGVVGEAAVEGFDEAGGAARPGRTGQRSASPPHPTTRPTQQDPPYGDHHRRADLCVSRHAEVPLEISGRRR